MSRRLTAEHDGLAIEVRLEDTDERRGLLGLTPTGRLTDDEVTHWRDHFTEAWRILASRHRDAALTLRAVLTCVVPVEADPAAAGISATSADAFGAVAISRPDDGLSLAVGLLHETQHSLLNAAGHLFDLHQRPHDRSYSPWRDDPRPASGILQGAYAYLAVTRFWRTESRAGGDRLATFEFLRWREAVATAAARLLAAGTLTTAGTRLVSALHDEVTAWLAEPPTDQEVERLAGMANTDHYARWRLENMRPRPSGIEALTAAWRKGDPAPRVTSILTPATRRALPHSPRLHRIHALLRGPGAGSGASGQTRATRVTAFEAALLRGDYGTFRDSYPANEFDLDPTALAIALGMVERIEALVAIRRETRDDPVALALWLGDSPGGSLS